MSSLELKNKSEKEEKIKEKRSSMLGLFRYADWVDILLMIMGTAGAIGDGMSTNCVLVFASRLMNSLGYGNTKENNGNFMDQVEQCTLNFVYLGLAVWVVAFMEGYCWSRTSERQVLRIRYEYLEAVLRQEAGFFDSQEATTAEIIESVTKDTSLIQEVLSEKVPLFLMHSSVFISGLAFSSYFSWRLSIVAFPFVILLVIPGLIYGKYLLFLSKKSHEEYNKANNIVEQALCSIRTVYSFTAEKRTVERYSDILDKTMKLGIKQGLAKGMAVGSTGIAFAIWAFLAWYGSRLVMYKGESGGRIYAAGISFILGGLSLGVALPDVKYFTEASVAAARIFARIDRIPTIDDGEGDKGKTLDQVNGKLEFARVKFSYPSRPDATILRDFELVVPAGKTIALVGPSGSGKSTVIGLVQRFYDVDGGEVRVDGVDVRELQLKWLRNKMGLVSQEHALFATSIRENIMFGKPEATMDEICAAAMTANAHNFIRQLPEGYETKIGERGALLSGGQKQRIAIARAVIKNPPILLLDEATSALDSESEKLVQNALDQASMGRTTLVVAHKLATVRNADQIAVVANGRAIEIGTHNELINRKNGHYARLVKLQRQLSAEDQEHQQQQPTTPSITRSSTSHVRTAKSPPLSFPSPPPQPNPSLSLSSPSFTRLLTLNSPEWKQALMGSLSATLFGAIQPTYAITIGAMIAAFFAADRNEMPHRVRTYSFVFLSLSIISLLTNIWQHYNFATMGEALERRIRISMLERILTFEVAWFDEEENSSAALCSGLSAKAAMVKSLVADRISLLLQTTSAVGLAMGMGLFVAWRLAIVMIAVQPLSIMCFYTRRVLLSSMSVNSIRAQGRSSQIAAEAVCNHKIVKSFGCRDLVMRVFLEAQEGPRKAGIKKAWMAGIGMGSAQCLTFMAWALDFWYGGKLMESGKVSAGDVFKTFFILVSTGKVIADAGSMTSDLAKGSTAVASLFAVLDRKSKIPASGSQTLERFSGLIEMQKVDFAYPSRPENLVLCGFCLEVKAGTSLGLAGKSGCGKSTVIGLIQRFYDVQRGVVRVDGVDIREVDIKWLRGFMALVSQEPVIFSGSIRENILFGLPESGEGEVVEAAIAANAHDFISSLIDGYETECGERGMQLSGGQKQRIAIARAILRNPTILLLDEATSALDAQSEQAVKEALDRIMVKRTTIVVAHRLNTIKKLDSIAFVAEGKVVEQGSYAQLKSKRGAFFNLAGL